MFFFFISLANRLDYTFPQVTGGASQINQSIPDTFVYFETDAEKVVKIRTLF